jgi:hypothetical protein
MNFRVARRVTAMHSRDVCAIGTIRLLLYRRLYTLAHELRVAT